MLHHPRPLLQHAGRDRELLLNGNRAMTRNRFAAAVDVLVAVVCVTILVALGLRLWGPERAAAGAFPDVTGTPIADTVNIDWSSAERTLGLSLHSKCRFCTASLPFYKRLLDARGDAPLQVVAAASTQDADIHAYLELAGVRVDRVVTVEAGELPITPAPTLFLMNPAGVIVDTWVGELGEDQETAVMEALFERVKNVEPEDGPVRKRGAR